MYKIVPYRTPDGKKVFRDWLLKLKDKNLQHRILARIDRLALGNFGDCKPVGQGISELRFHFGPGYRVYFAMAGRFIIVLLCAGDKSNQDSDIAQAKENMKDFLRRKDETLE